MNIGIITNFMKDENLEITKEIISWLKARDVNVLCDEELSKDLAITKAADCSQYMFQVSDVVIVLGGDGTLLNVARLSSCCQVPLFGINIGHLGFLTEIEIVDTYASLEKILRGDYTIEKRMMLEAFIENNENQTQKFIALNDIVLTKGGFSRLISYNIHINDEFVDSYQADGVIICSPTGSTAYSLSAGGPIVAPDVEVLTITPICPHTLHSRSILVSNKDLVRVEITKNNQTNISMTVDGQAGVVINPGDVVTVQQSKYYANLVKLSNRSFFDVLRAKMSDRSNQKKNIMEG